jgi:hypothetical protein
MYNLIDSLAPQGVFLQASVGEQFLIFRGSLKLEAPEAGIVLVMLLFGAIQR